MKVGGKSRATDRSGTVFCFFTYEFPFLGQSTRFSLRIKPLLCGLDFNNHRLKLLIILGLAY